MTKKQRRRRAVRRMKVTHGRNLPKTTRRIRTRKARSFQYQPRAQVVDTSPQSAPAVDHSPFAGLYESFPKKEVRLFGEVGYSSSELILHTLLDAKNRQMTFGELRKKLASGLSPEKIIGANDNDTVTLIQVINSLENDKWIAIDKRGKSGKPLLASIITRIH